MKRLRPTTESRISRLQRLYNSSTRRQRWHTYSDDPDLERVAELIDQVAEPIEEGALEELLGFSKRSHFSRYYSDDMSEVVEDVEPADNKLINQLESLAKQYGAPEYSEFSRKNRLYSELNPEELKEFFSEIAVKYTNVFNKLVEVGLLFENGRIVDPDTIGSEQRRPLRSPTEKYALVKVLTPAEFDELTGSLYRSTRRTTALVRAKLVKRPNTAAKYEELANTLGVAIPIAMAAIFVLILGGIGVALGTYAPFFAKILGSLMPVFKQLAMWIRSLDISISPSEGWKIIVEFIGGIIALVLTGNALGDWIDRLLARARAKDHEKLLQCVIDANKITMELSRRSRNVNSVIQYMCRANNMEASSFVSRLEQEFSHIKDLQSEYKDRLRCLDVKV